MWCSMKSFILIRVLQSIMHKKMRRTSLYRSWNPTQKNNRLILRKNWLKFCNRKSCQRSGEFQGIFQWRTSLARSRRVFLHVVMYLTTASIWLLSPKLNLSQLKKLSRMINGLLPCMRNNINSQEMMSGFLIQSLTR